MLLKKSFSISILHVLLPYMLIKHFDILYTQLLSISKMYFLFISAFHKTLPTLDTPQNVQNYNSPTKM
ncbi:hypothetical protein ATO12_17670 [Aquimarina atlantica]|uniref:Uncharacterized protein n=1 Tax=Aquimarina atlantica TaxID=1317122 RepID=A0A023BVE1_9FLAO|nr:hypothetical protein ATO12_17670 [Aquimarina atlantica]